MGTDLHTLRLCLGMGVGLKSSSGPEASARLSGPPPPGMGDVEDSDPREQLMSAFRRGAIWGDLGRVAPARAQGTKLEDPEAGKWVRCLQGMVGPGWGPRARNEVSSWQRPLGFCLLHLMGLFWEGTGSGSWMGWGQPKGSFSVRVLGSR